jgi:hypothetical protein
MPEDGFDQAPTAGGVSLIEPVGQLEPATGGLSRGGR